MSLINVLQVGSWVFGQSNLAGSTGLIGQVTRCELDGVEFYVRENVTAIPSFQISSAERMGDKVGRKPSRRRQALELLAPADRWDEIAAEVKRADRLGRPVLLNRSFTWSWASSIFTRS